MTSLGEREIDFGALCPAEPGQGGVPGIELAHNVRSPAEVDDVLAEAERAGGRIASAAAPAEWGGYTGASADPDGHVWEVAHNPDLTIERDGTIRLQTD